MAFKCERWTLANILPVAFVIWVISTIWMLYVWLHLLPLLQLGSLPTDRDESARQRGQVELLISQPLTLVLLICFIRAIFTDPGSVPQTPDWSPEPKGAKIRRSGKSSGSSGEESERLLPEAQCVELKQSGERRFCKWCDSYKPDRCHHCRICKSCILRMDHHCPWIANCVGFRNHKYFFLVVFYALLNLAFIITTMAESMSKAIVDETPPMHRFLLVFCMTLSSLMAFLLFVFFSMHIWLMLNAMTTIEFCEKRHKWGSYADGATLSYDIGLYRNLCAVLGPMPPLWLLPVMPPSGDGLFFASKREIIKDSSNKANGSVSAPTGGDGAQPENNAEKRPSRDLPPEVTGAKAAVA